MDLAGGATVHTTNNYPCMIGTYVTIFMISGANNYVFMLSGANNYVFMLSGAKIQGKEEGNL